LGAETKRPQILVYYDLMERLIDENEDLIFEIELTLFSKLQLKINGFIVECGSFRN